MNRLFIKQNITSLSILLFIILFGIMAYVKPSFVFHKDGTVRQFGIGYKNKTVIPIWLIVIVMAYLSYLFLLYLQVFWDNDALYNAHYSKLTTTSTFSVLILLIAETDNSSRFFRVLFFSLLISFLTSFAISKSSPHDEDDVDEMEDRDEAVEFDEDERFDVLFLAFMSSSMVP